MGTICAKWLEAVRATLIKSAEAMTAPRAREQADPPSPPDRLPPRRGGRLSPHGLSPEAASEAAHQGGTSHSFDDSRGPARGARCGDAVARVPDRPRRPLDRDLTASVVRRLSAVGRIRRFLAGRRSLAAAALLALCGALAVSPSAYALIVTTLVSNIGQSTASALTSVTDLQPISQRFSTGADAESYFLSSVDVVSHRSGINFSVKVCTVGSGNAPTSDCIDLTAPFSINAGTNSFTAPAGTSLAPSTTYSLFITGPTFGGGDASVLKGTLADNEDAGHASGWSIANAYERLSGYEGISGDREWVTESSGLSIKVAIKVTSTTASTDATLSALVVSDGGTGLTLTPTFAADTYAYAASVGNTVDEVTVTLSTGHAGAVISSWLDGSDMTLADADTTEAGFQVVLAEGANVIKVKVTAEDGITTRTYTVTVTRSALPELSVANASAFEGSEVIFTVTLSKAATQNVSATWTASLETGDTAAAADLTDPAATGTVTVTANQTTATFTVAMAQDTTDEDDETFTVTLSDPSSNADLARDPTATGTIADDDPLPTLSVEDASATEGDPVVFTVTLTPASGKTVTVRWYSEQETGINLPAAAPDLDFVSTGGALTFDPGQTERTIDIATSDDTLDEADEVFSFALSSPQNAKFSLLSSLGTSGTIVDDDALPALSIADAAGTEGGSVTFTVTLSPVSGREVTVDWATSVEGGDTAVSGTDFTEGSGTLAIPAGETTGTVSVKAASDSASESDETFTLTLSSAAHATLPADAKATGTIQDNPIPAPAAPGNFMATAGNAVVELSWDAPAADAAITRHEYRYKTGGGYPATWTSIADSAPGGTSQAGFTVTRLVLGTAHTFQIRAVGAGGVGAVATSAVVTPQQTMTLTCTSGPDDLWCGVLTVGRTSSTEDDSASGYCGPGCAGGSEEYGQLGDTSFELDGTTYMIQSIRWDTHPSNTWTLYLDLDRLPAESVWRTWYLRVGANSFGALSEDNGNQLTVGNAYNYGLTPPALNTLVTVRLTTSSEGVLSDNNDLMGLTVNDGSTDLTVSPTFDLFKYIYTASVPYVVETVTVTATPEDDGASVSFRDADGFTLDDADGTEDGFQVALDVGGNAIDVQVTAENGSPSADIYTLTVTREEGPPTLSVAGASAAEGSGVTFTVTLSAAATADVTATWTASIESGDTAVAADFTDLSAATGMVTVTANQTTATITVATAQDTTDEDDETFTVTLSNSSNATLGDATATGTITDDDAPPTISVRT